MKLEVVAATMARHKGLNKVKATSKGAGDQMPEGKTFFDRAETGGAEIRRNDDNPSKTEILVHLPGENAERFCTIASLDDLRNKKKQKPRNVVVERVQRARMHNRV